MTPREQLEEIERLRSENAVLKRELEIKKLKEENERLKRELGGVDKIHVIATSNHIEIIDEGE